MNITPQQARAELARREITNRKTAPAKKENGFYEKASKYLGPTLEGQVGMPTIQDRAMRAMTDVYTDNREKLLESNAPIVGKGARSGLSDQPVLKKSIPDLLKAVLGPGANVAEIALKNSPREMAKQAQGIGIDVAADALASGVPSIVGKKILKPASEAMESLGGRLLNFYIKPRAAGYKFGSNPGMSVVKHIGPQMSRENLLEAIVNKKSELMDRLEESVANSDGRVDATPIFQEISSQLSKLKKFPETYSEQIKAHRSLANDFMNIIKEYATFKDGKVLVNPQDALQIKRALGEMPSWATMDPKLGSLTKTSRKAYGRFDREIDKVVPESAELNEDVSGLIGAQKGIELGKQRENNKNPFGLIDTLVGLTAGGTAGPVAGLGAALGSKALRSATVQTTAASAFGVAGKAGKATAKALESTKRPMIIQELLDKILPKESRMVVQNIAEETADEPLKALGRNNKFSASRKLPNFETGKPPIELSGRGEPIILGGDPTYTKTGHLPTTEVGNPSLRPIKPAEMEAIELPDTLESDYAGLAEKYGIPTYGGPRQNPKDVGLKKRPLRFGGQPRISLKALAERLKKK